jgi:hypothetical protein
MSSLHTVGKSGNMTYTGIFLYIYTVANKKYKYLFFNLASFVADQLTNSSFFRKSKLILIISAVDWVLIDESIDDPL